MEHRKLTGIQRAALKALGQRLDSSLSVGRSGVTRPVIKELDRMLSTEELVKVRFNAERNERETAMDLLADKTHSTLVGSVGKTALFYRPFTTQNGSVVIPLPKKRARKP